ncbi:MAG: putative selenate reductase subunit YgfK [Bacteroidetes bacterium]|nr:putative selenate reductase subunit YgfK [Bacteroidota bacterium]
MSEKFATVSLKTLLQLIFKQLSQGSFFGIPESLFYKDHKPQLVSYRFNQRMDTPLGVAAGPHTQLAQNIVAAWLCGARYIELKTVQTLDEINVSKPCIDMQDEGYNCEWSQELTIRESFDQYLNAWIIIHILYHKMKMGKGENPGTIFNMSVGYDLKGIQQENMRWFFDKMRNCRLEKEKKIEEISHIFPDVSSLTIPDCISDNVTLSTMHGCPPGEIEKIARYLILDKHLHTTIKLNPTLLGAESLRAILNTRLGFNTPVPDEAFTHDLTYDAAITLIQSLSELALGNDRFFGVKLTNTMECMNFRDVFSREEKMMYMSGKPLHPISVNLAFKLQQTFEGRLNISFSAGAGCFNFKDLLSCGLSPVTVCSDLLKPGGYGRLNQYLEEARSFDMDKLTNPLINLEAYSQQVLQNRAYQKGWTAPDIKTPLMLSRFDCIHAPCTCTCPSSQDIPEYLRYTAREEFDSAFEVILRTNPFPAATGLVCDHLCQTRCTRVHYDEAIRIRDVKYFITTKKKKETLPVKKPSTGLKAVIIGAGPSGLACAWFLQLAGCSVTVYEENSMAGGLALSVIPSFRLPLEELNKDIERIIRSGVKVRYGVTVDRPLFARLREENDFVYLATGAKMTKKLSIPGSAANGVMDPLQFLADIKRGRPFTRGRKIVVIGGGNTAIDTARTARRLVTQQGSVTVLYRRRLKEMPAAHEEIMAALDEGITLIEMTSPLEIQTHNNAVTGLVCIKNKPGLPDESGRATPVPVTGSEFTLEAEVVIPALGQDITSDIIDLHEMKCDPESGLTRLHNVFIGGDARRGASSVIKAIGDGRKAAAFMLQMNTKETAGNESLSEKEINDILVQKARKRPLAFASPENKPVNTSFSWDPSVLGTNEAIQESKACLSCDLICNNCVSVCPNLANFSYRVNPSNYQLSKAIRQDSGFILKVDINFRVQQEFQVLHLADFCNECGNCATFCPTKGAPYKDKPTLYFSEKEYRSSKKGMIFKSGKTGKVLHYKEDDKEVTLEDISGKWKFGTDEFIAIIDKKTFVPIEITWKTKTVKNASFFPAAEMSVFFGSIAGLCE